MQLTLGQQSVCVSIFPRSGQEFMRIRRAPCGTRPHDAVHVPTSEPAGWGWQSVARKERGGRTRVFGPETRNSHSRLLSKRAERPRPKLTPAKCTRLTANAVKEAWAQRRVACTPEAYRRVLNGPGGVIRLHVPHGSP